MIEYLDSLDKELMLYLNYDGGAFLDQLWWIISGKFTWTPLYLLLIWMIYDRHKGGANRWKAVITLVIITALVVVLSDQIASGIIKHAVMRPRPSRPDSGISELIHIVNDYRGGHYGFVSSHAANTWGLSLWFILLFHSWIKEGVNRTKKRLMKGLMIVLPLWAGLNCYSRIYLGVHYPGDILGGLIVGTIVALFCYYVIYLPTKKGKIPFFETIFENVFIDSVGSL